jgi:hypothetical protein
LLQTVPSSLVEKATPHRQCIGALEELSDHARNRLWDIFHVNIHSANTVRDAISEEYRLLPPFSTFLRLVWKEIYRERVDEYMGAAEVLMRLKRDFIEGAHQCLGVDSYPVIRPLRQATVDT